MIKIQNKAIITIYTLYGILPPSPVIYKNLLNVLQNRRALWKKICVILLFFP